MRLQVFTRNPVEQQGYSMGKLNEALAGAVHVETYTKDEGRCGGDKTITIFAFYPDKEGITSEDNICKHGCFGTCCGKGA